MAGQGNRCVSSMPAPQPYVESRPSRRVDLPICTNAAHRTRRFTPPAQPPACPRSRRVLRDISVDESTSRAAPGCPRTATVWSKINTLRVDVDGCGGVAGRRPLRRSNATTTLSLATWSSRRSARPSSRGAIDDSVPATRSTSWPRCAVGERRAGVAPRRHRRARAGSSMDTRPPSCPICHRAAGLRDA